MKRPIQAIVVLEIVEMYFNVVCILREYIAIFYTVNRVVLEKLKFLR
jgi:hypothetical protein